MKIRFPLDDSFAEDFKTDIEFKALCLKSLMKTK